MRSRYRIIDDEKVYFVTSTTIEWIPVFTEEKYFKIVTGALKYAQENKDLKVYAYVILENHFHLIVSSNKLSGVLGSLKSYTARMIIDTLKSNRKEWLLNQLAYYKLKHKVYSDYQLWQEELHPQIIYTAEILNQKIDYIHFNPVRRGYVNEPHHWKYSSAGFYYFGNYGEIKIDQLC